jgi:DNA-binding NarL/FixJ family response regulator
MRVRLTRREAEIVVLLFNEGLPDRAIAERLSISPETVRRHMANIRDKTGADNRVEVILYARQYPEILEAA